MDVSPFSTLSYVAGSFWTKKILNHWVVLDAIVKKKKKNHTCFLYQAFTEYTA